MPAGSAALAHLSVTEPLRVDDVYRAHADFVWRTVQRFGVPAAEAEDLVHEVFMVVQRRLPEFEGDALPSWLYAICRGVAANYRRGRTRAERRVHGLEQEPPPPARSLEDAAAEREAAAAVDRFLATLDADTRAIFELADIEGLTCPEIARATGLDLGRVHARLKTARRRFNAFVAQQPGGNSA